jgi:hypothetical protein
MTLLNGDLLAVDVELTLHAGAVRIDDESEPHRRSVPPGGPL